MYVFSFSTTHFHRLHTGAVSYDAYESRMFLREDCNEVVIEHHAKPMTLCLQKSNKVGTTLHGGCLGFRADEGRGKLRNVSGRRMRPLNRESPNQSERTGNAGN